MRYYSYPGYIARGCYVARLLARLRLRLPFCTRYYVDCFVTVRTALRLIALHVARFTFTVTFCWLLPALVTLRLRCLLRWFDYVYLIAEFDVDFVTFTVTLRVCCLHVAVTRLRLRWFADLVTFTHVGCVTLPGLRPFTRYPTPFV